MPKSGRRDIGRKRLSSSLGYVDDVHARLRSVIYNCLKSTTKTATTMTIRRTAAIGNCSALIAMSMNIPS